MSDDTATPAPRMVDLKWKGTGSRVASRADDIVSISETRDPQVTRVVFRSGDSMAACEPTYDEIRALLDG